MDRAITELKDNDPKKIHNVNPSTTGSQLQLHQTQASAITNSAGASDQELFGQHEPPLDLMHCGSGMDLMVNNYLPASGGFCSPTDIFSLDDSLLMPHSGTTGSAGLCPKSHNHYPWPKRGRLVIQKCEKRCDFCGHVSKSAAALRKHVYGHKDKDGLDITIVPGTSGRSRRAILRTPPPASTSAQNATLPAPVPPDNLFTSGNGAVTRRDDNLRHNTVRDTAGLSPRVEELDISGKSGADGYQNPTYANLVQENARLRAELEEMGTKNQRELKKWENFCRWQNKHSSEFIAKITVSDRIAIVARDLATQGGVSTYCKLRNRHSEPDYVYLS
ncbi:hypothetical protein F5Y19DRAFT_442016 [Xylariaceae sp. FL1651]|nr:hypothetical protein F5Y19DRAFT_442016 [Xylariaceae sp. FL1651]